MILTRHRNKVYRIPVYSHSELPSLFLVVINTSGAKGHRQCFKSFTRGILSTFFNLEIAPDGDIILTIAPQVYFNHASFP